MAEATEEEEHHHASYKLVPWINWEEWDFVRKSLFSSSPQSVAAAFKRISAWRARGNLPIAIEITAAVVEIQQKDSFFRKGLSDDDLNSDEMLAMSYCMAIMRLVNGFVENSCKEKRPSISSSAEAIGIPRVLVDVRHEASHRDLPSLPLVRLASIKALDWLKSNYWEPQRKAIPNVRKETKSTMREMVLCLHSMHAQRSGSLQIKRKCVKHSKLLSGRFSHVAGMHLCSKSGGLSVKHMGFKKQSSILGSLIRLYSTFPSEVVTVLLEEFLLKIPGPLDGTEVTGCSGDSEAVTGSGISKSHLGTIDDWKVTIARLTSKEPALLLTMLEAILEMIETRESMKLVMGECHLPSSNYRAEIRQIEILSSLLLWLLKHLNEAKNSSSGGSKDSEGNIPALPMFEAVLPTPLRRCLTLLSPDNTSLLDSALLLAKMIGKDSLTERLKKLLLRGTPNLDCTVENTNDINTEHAILQHEESISRAEKKLEFLKQCQMKGKTAYTELDHGSMERKPWTVAQSWSKCPIGMLPRAFGSSGVLPILDQIEKDRPETNGSLESKDYHRGIQSNGKRDPSCDVEFLEDAHPVKKIRETVNGSEGLLEGRDDLQLSPMEGQLMIDGVWKNVGEGELLAIESGVRILV